MAGQDVESRVIVADATLRPSSCSSCCRCLVADLLRPRIDTHELGDESRITPYWPQRPA